MTRSAPPRQITFEGASHNALVADRFGEHGASVMLLHGGGQTRHAWRRTASRLATEGFTAFAIDQRGHGDSAWIADGDYAFASFAADAAAIAQQICKLTESTPIAIGASLGGIASLLAEGEASDAAAALFSALVLVDITPRVDPGGVAKIHDFMRAHAQQGFASVAEAAASVAAYLPHRPTPKANDGLKKNLRLHPDGRWRWHWDPAFLNGSRGVPAEREKLERELLHAATTLREPVLLVRGASSELVHQAHVDEFHPGSACGIRRCGRRASHGGGRPQRRLFIKNHRVLRTGSQPNGEGTKLGNQGSGRKPEVETGRRY